MFKISSTTTSMTLELESSVTLEASRLDLPLRFVTLLLKKSWRRAATPTSEFSTILSEMAGHITAVQTSSTVTSHPARLCLKTICCTAPAPVELLIIVEWRMSQKIIIFTEWQLLRMEQSQFPTCGELVRQIVASFNHFPTITTFTSLITLRILHFTRYLI